MRDYATISPRFWIGGTGKQIKASGPEAIVVAMYLLTSPHANMLGLYYLPKYYLQHDTGLTMEGASKGLLSCIEANFCAYDELTEMVWVFNMARDQIGDRLKPADKRVAGIQNQYDKLPENPFLSAFYDKYGDVLAMRRRRGNAEFGLSPLGRGLEAPSKPLRSQEQEQEQEQEQKKPRSHAHAHEAKTKLSANAQPNAKNKAAAAEYGLTEDRFRKQWRKFRSHYVAVGSLMENWDAAWEKWLSNIECFDPGPGGARPPPGARPTAASRLLKMYATPEDLSDESSSSVPFERSSAAHVARPGEGGGGFALAATPGGAHNLLDLKALGSG